jgi:hypothetical protein
VYTVDATNVVVTVGDQVTVPEYWPLSVIVLTGLAPDTGATTLGTVNMVTGVAATGPTYVLVAVPE